MLRSTLDDKIDQVRKFNRFFTRKIGALREGLLHSSYSLTEVRILFEIANSDTPTATKLSRQLGLDAGYLSRILASFEEQGLTKRVRSEQDGRQYLIRLTPEGMKLFSQLDQRSREKFYSKAGFKLVKQEAHNSFGKDLIGETWELVL
jgi:DNA-binding MarR family transcriptional regulator